MFTKIIDGLKFMCLEEIVFFLEKLQYLWRLPFFLPAYHQRGGFIFALSFSNTFSLAKYSGIMRSEA
jgi:hypothetical protein